MIRFPMALLLSLLTVAHASAQDADGYLVVTANVDDFFLVVNHDFDHPYMMSSGDSLRLPAGSHVITLVTRTDFDYEFTTTIAADRSTRHSITLAQKVTPETYARRSSYPWMAGGINLIVLADDDSYVFVDFERVGRGTTWLSLPSGTHTVMTHHSIVGPRAETVDVRDGRGNLTVLSLYNLPRAQTARTLSLVPGLSQLYQNQKIKAVAFSAASLGGLALVQMATSSYRERNEAYEAVLLLYEGSRDEKEIVRLAREAQDAHQEANKAAVRRNVMLGALAAVYALNVLDAWLPPRGGFRTSVGRGGLSPLFTEGGSGIQLSIRL